MSPEPGGSAPRDLNYKNISSKYLSIQSRNVLNSLHELTPANKEHVQEAIKEIQELLQCENNIPPEERETLIDLGRKAWAARLRRVEYSKNDIGPYTIIIESTEKNVAGLHYSDLSKMLYQIKVEGITNITKKRFNKVGVEFITYQQVNNLLINDKLQQKSLIAYIPQRLLSTKGIIRGVGQLILQEDIVQESYSNKEIIEAKRLDRKFREGGKII